MAQALVKVGIILEVFGSLNANKEFQQIKNRLALIQTRQDAETLARHEGFSTILDKLGEIESRLNDSGQIGQCFENYRHLKPEIEQKVFAADLKRPIYAIIGAIKAEKQVNVGIRKQVPKLEKSVEEMRKEITNMADTIDTIKEALPTIGDIFSVMTESSEKILNVCLIAQQMNVRTANAVDILAEKLDVLENSVKSQFREVILENIGLTLNRIQQDVAEKFNRVIESTRISMASKRHSSCLDILSYGETRSGEYTVYPQNWYTPLQVYCDMDTEGGGWTVFQRREDGSEEFNRGWDDYAMGFGNLTHEFWLGNEHLSIMTKECCHELRVDLQDFESDAGYAKYGRFKVLPAEQQFRLLVADYSGNVGDSLSYQTNMSFSTKDKDFDTNESDSCAVFFQSAWWFNNCHKVNLNGLYLKGRTKANNYGKGVIWAQWKDKQYSLKMSEMKFRKVM